MKQKLQIAVRALIEHVLRSGDLEQTFLGASRAVEGIRAHQTIQHSRPETYTPEVTVSHEIETDRFTLIVGGRIDGVFHVADQVIIEEIKTTVHDLKTFADKDDPIHWGQAKCYAYLYGFAHNLKTVGIQLTYRRLDTGEIREFQKTFSIESLEAFFQDIAHRYLYWADTVVDWGRVRDASLASLEFPFSAYRSGQREMAVDVYRSIRQGDQMLIQAATGIGKTMAVIFPAAKALAEGLTPKIFYLTARTTAKTIAEKTLDILRNNGARVKSLTLTAKEKICFDSEKACTPEECEFAKGHFDRINGALQEIFKQDTFDRGTVADIAQIHRVCPFELSLELALWSDCIICDYNYAFDPRVFLRRFFMEENNGFVFLVDEAHNLVDRAREMFSSEIRKQPFLDIRRPLKSDLPAVYRSMGKINSWFVQRRKACEAAGNSIAGKEPPEELIPLLRGFLRLAERWLGLNIKTVFREDLLGLYFAVGGFIKISEQYDESYVTCTEKIEKDLRVKLFCVDPSGPLKNALSRCNAAVFFSATLSPMGYFKKIFGCEDNAVERVFSSPFPEENLCVLVSDRISTRYRHREQTRTAVTSTLVNLVEQKKGNYLLFFPSYQYMRMIYSDFITARPHTETLLQTPEMTEAERDRFLERFSTETPNTLVGFVVMGGVFGEGIDLAGERLSGAGIVGVGLPGISLERELIRDYFDHSLRSGFEYAYLYPGIIRVLQAAGRVIRSEDDRGAVLLVGQRFTASPYRDLLPEAWHPASVQDDDRFRQVLGNFWKR